MLYEVITPEVVAALSGYAERYGVGSGASRLISGNMEVHAELEEAVARFKGAEACLSFSSGYLANLGILQTLGGPDTVITSYSIHYTKLYEELPEQGIVLGVRDLGGVVAVVAVVVIPDQAPKLQGAVPYRRAGHPLLP